MKPAVERVAAALRAAGVEADIQEFAESTHTAEEAAAAIGTTVAQIVKSLVFVADGRAILALVSGTNRVDTKRLGAVVGARISRADADVVREATGYAIGGVPPVGHATALATYIDRDLLQFAEVWAAAGTPNAVFRTTPETLIRLTSGTVVDLAVTQ